ncbi:class I SAM-dependent methyltransferase [Salmonella enterica subsp. enterica serovar Virchow]|nr:class I SAM-dependent methyltransferase [Salmonella enterica subsp. enterica serovar Virchow]
MNHFENKVSETLLIPLICKAEESLQPNAIIVDNVACDIVNKLSIDLKKYTNKKISRTGTALRARYFDLKTEEFITKNPSPIVITLGCGLDARYHRLDNEIRNKAFFYYLDFTDVISVRKRFIPEQHNEKYISGSMLSHQWIAVVKEKAEESCQLLFLIEGVLMYIPEHEVRNLFNTLCLNFKTGLMICDVLSRWLSSKSDAHDTVRYTAAEFSFGFDDDSLPTTWNSKLIHRETRLFTDFKEYTRMGFPLNILMTYFEKYKKSARILTYEIME